MSSTVSAPYRISSVGANSADSSGSGTARICPQRPRRPWPGHWGDLALIGARRIALSPDSGSPREREGRAGDGDRHPAIDVQYDL